MDVVQLLSVAYSGSKEERTAATAELERALESADAPLHLVALIRAGTDMSLLTEQSLSALIYAKNYIVHKLDDSCGIDANVMGKIQDALYEGMFQVPVTHQNIICACIMTLVSMSGWNYLPKLMPEILRSREDIPVKQSFASLRLLYAFVKRFKTPTLEPMPMKLEVCSSLVTALPSFMLYEEFYVDHIVLKIIECVVETVLQTRPEENIPAHVFDEWLSMMASYPERHFAPFAGEVAGGPHKDYENYVRCLKRIAMISYSLLNDATKKRKPLPVAKHFLTNHAAAFFNVWSRWLKYSSTSASRGTHHRVDSFAIRFVKLCSLDKNLYLSCLRPCLMQVVESALFPFLCYSKEDEAPFDDENDLSDFSQYLMDGAFGESELSTRTAASNAILALVRGEKNYHEDFLLPLLDIISTGLSREDTPETLPQSFGFLHLFLALRRHLRKVPEIWNGQVAQFLARFVVPRMLSTSICVPLRVKAIATYQRYVKAPVGPDDFASFMQLFCSLVQDPDPRVRLCVIDAMCTILEMRQSFPYIKPVLIPLVEECMDFLNRVKTTFVPTVLLYLVDNFSPELKQVLHKLGKVLVRLFLSTAFDMAQHEIMADGSSDDYWRADMSACALLDALENVVQASTHDAQVFQSILPDTLRLIKAVMETADNHEFVEKTLAIWLIVVNNAKPIPQECWDLLPLLFNCIDSGVGVDFFASIEEVLDNYVSNETAQYIQNAGLMEATYSACEKVLIHSPCDTSDKMGVPQLIEAMLHQAKHCQVAYDIFNTYLPRFVLLLLRALRDESICDGEAKLQVWIVAALMDAFYFNAAETLNIMVTSGAYPQFFDALFSFFRAAVTQPRCGKKKKLQPGKSSDGHEVIESLSLLTRKVITLGLTSLLHHLSAASRGAVESDINLSTFQSYLRPTVALIEHCIFTNHTMLVTRCRLSEENIARIRQGGPLEDAEDVDLEDEDMLGIDECSSDDFDDADGIDTCASGDGEGSEMDTTDEGDDYISPIDDICEVTLFLQWTAQLNDINGAQQAVFSALSKPIEEFTEAETTARRYRQLLHELNTALEADFNSRTVN